MDTLDASRRRAGFVARRNRPRRRLRLAVLGALIAVSIGATTASGATWSLQSTPNPAGVDDSYLHAVGCEPSSTNLCMAVGMSTTAGVDRVLAEQWNGSSWSLSSPVVPGSSLDSQLNDVLCLSTTSCTAVGSYRTASGTFTLAETWNGTSWAIQSTANAAGASTTSLNGISCVGASACTAVGYAVTAGVRTAIAQSWNGASWTMQRVPIPAGATSSEFDGVSCRGSAFCMAVGRYVDSGGQTRSLSASWDGLAWSLETVPDPAGARKSVLLDSTCTGTSPSIICTAAGGYFNSSNVQLTLIVRWTGTSWSIMPSPNPTGSAASVLQSVVCSNTASTACVAVGDWISGGTNVTLAERWNGTSWSIDTTQNPAGTTFSVLWGAACRGSTCLAVGWSTNALGVNTTQAQID